MGAKMDDETFMRLALAEAERARLEGEVPVGAVLVRGKEILARAYNAPIGRTAPSAHADILAIRQAAAAVGNYRLTGTTRYVTLEPCIMCAGAILQARLARVVFGAPDSKNGGVVSLYRLFEDKRFNHAVSFTSGV